MPLSSESHNRSPSAAWPWRKGYYQPLKHWELFTQKHSSTFLKPWFVCITAARTSNFAHSTALLFCKWNLLVKFLHQCGTLCTSVPPCHLCCLDLTLCPCTSKALRHAVADAFTIMLWWISHKAWWHIGLCFQHSNQHTAELDAYKCNYVKDLILCAFV